jgi:hypothetical protein
MDNENNQSNAWIWVVVVVLLLIGGFFAYNSFKGKSSTTIDNNGTSTPSGTLSSTTVRPYGEVTVKLGETAQFRGISITPLTIAEDSRCPVGVQCVQAGTVRVNTQTQVTNGTPKPSVIGLGATSTVDTFTISLVSVTPGTKSGSKIADADYRLTYRVHQSAVVDNELIGK